MEILGILREGEEDRRWGELAIWRDMPGMDGYIEHKRCMENWKGGLRPILDKTGSIGRYIDVDSLSLISLASSSCILPSNVLLKCKCLRDTIIL